MFFVFFVISFFFPANNEDTIAYSKLTVYHILRVITMIKGNFYVFY